jgi:hypothetical protein
MFRILWKKCRATMPFKAEVGDVADRAGAHGGVPGPQTRSCQTHSSINPYPLLAPSLKNGIRGLPPCVPVSLSAFVYTFSR